MADWVLLGWGMTSWSRIEEPAPQRGGRKVLLAFNSPWGPGMLPGFQGLWALLQSQGFRVLGKGPPLPGPEPWCRGWRGRFCVSSDSSPWFQAPASLRGAVLPGST